MYCSNNPSTKYTYYTYHFNSSNDEFIIIFGWEYFSPMLIYYPKTNNIYNISYRYSNILINNNIDNLFKNINYNITYYPTHNYTSYIIGLIGNSGHYFWQEVHGLMILIEYELLDNIDEFIIYKYDYLNIAYILKNKFNKKIKYIKSENEIHALTVNITKHYITNSSTELFKNIYDLNSINVKSNNINIMFDIRSNSRVWLNQIPIIINIMNVVNNKYNKYNIKFYISGFYKYDKIMSYTNYNNKKEIQIQNKIFNTIQSNVKFKIVNLINMNLFEILQISKNIDLCITNLGSGIGFYYSTIFNKPTIGFTNKINAVAFNGQRYAFENKINNFISIDPGSISDVKEDFILRKGVLLKSVIHKINRILLNKF
jgi:hypothetical protein